MSKKIISIIISIIVLLLIAGGVWWYFQEPDITLIEYEDSPFGFSDICLGTDSCDILKNAGVEWLRTNVHWAGVQREEKNPLDFTIHDQKFKSIVGKGFNLIVDIEVTPFWAVEDKGLCNKLCKGREGCYPTYCSPDPKKFKEFCQKLVERYDGDGIDDNPYGIVIKHWEIYNEPDIGIGYVGTPEHYFEVLKEGYNGIKAADKDALVFNGAMAGSNVNSDFFENLMRINNGEAENYFDVLNFHTYWILDQISESIDKYTASLKESKPIWLTETASFALDPSCKPPYCKPCQNGNSCITPEGERRKAQDVIKRYVISLSLGVEKVFWFYYYNNINSDDAMNAQLGFGWSAGLVYVEFSGPPPKLIEGKFTPAYHTYKLMVEKLKGSDWDNIKTIQESNNVYAYKFIKKDSDEPVWVVWWDYFDGVGSSKTFSLDVGNINSVKITEAVPKYEAGQEVTDYSNAFNTETKTASNGKVTITLGENPVFVEKK